MLQLYISGLPAVIKQGVTFKLMRDNPFFANTGDSTYEVTLPLACLENQKIFGPLNLHQSQKSQFVTKKLPFILLAPPLPTLSGKAVVLDINQDDVKVQLLAGTTNFNDDSLEENGKDKYVDELNLGKAYEKLCPDAYQQEDPALYLRRFIFFEENQTPFYGNVNQTECVNFPIYSETDAAYANQHCLYKHYKELSMDCELVRKQFTYPGLDYGGPDEREDLTFAAQPYLVVIIERVIEALGYHVAQNEIRGTWMENIFIANVKSEYEYAKVLPHWTVSDFLREIRTFFGVFIQVVDKDVYIMSRAKYIMDKTATADISEVVDDFAVSLDEEDDTGDVSAGNVDYDITDIDTKLKLPDAVWEKAKIKHFPTEASMLQWIQANISEEDKAKSAYVFIDDSRDKVFAHLESTADQLFYLAEVDCCPALIRDGEQYGRGKRNINKKLKIVPALMDKELFDLYWTQGLEPGKTYSGWDRGIITLPCLISANSRESEYSNFSVNEEINKDTSTEGNKTGNGFDTIDVALNYCDTWHGEFIEAKVPDSFDFPMTYGIGYVKQNDGYYIPVLCPNNSDQFKLTKKTAPSIYDSVLSPGYSVDTRCEYTFSFLFRQNFSPLSVFLIKGRKYLCKQIEYTISDTGVNEIAIGHFFEVN